MRAGHCCRIVGWKRVAFSRLSQFTFPFGFADFLLLRDGSAMGDAITPSRVILCDALPTFRVNVKALDGGLQDVLEAFHLAALGTHPSEVQHRVASLVGVPLACGPHDQPISSEFFKDCKDASHACPGT